MSEMAEAPKERNHRNLKADRTARAHEDSDIPHKPRKVFDIDIFRGWCKSCGICAAFCPRECIELDENGSPFVKDSDRCTGCGWCELHCPDFAISVIPHKIKQARDESEEE